MDNSQIASLIVGVVQVIITFIACMLIDKVGRRALLMTAGIGMTASCVILGLYHALPVSFWHLR